MTVEGGGRPRPPAKTYSHFAGGERTPTDYEIATSRLHYYLGRGFEPALPLADWYRRHQVESPLRCDDWDRFRDPRQTTYAAYTALQHASEEQIDRIPDSPHDAGWLDLLDGLLPPARYLFHGFQMLAAYVGQMAPSSRITVVCALQAADEVRRVTRLARRMAAVRAVRPMFGEDRGRCAATPPGKSKLPPSPTRPVFEPNRLPPKHGSHCARDDTAGCKSLRSTHIAPCETTSWLSRRQALRPVWYGVDGLHAVAPSRRRRSFELIHLTGHAHEHLPE